MIFGNLYKLTDNLKNINRHTTVIDYSYNDIQAKVVVQHLPSLYQKIWPIMLTFYNMEDHSRDFSCHANRVRMSFNADEFAAFFHIENNSRGRMRDIISQFYKDFDKSIDAEIPDSYDGDDREAMERYFFQYDPYDERFNTYLCGIRTYHGNRDVLNSDKAAVLYPDIYKKYQQNKDICFFFSPNKADEKSLSDFAEI